MTVVSSIIQRAYRESNIIPIGVSASVMQQVEALQVLNSAIKSLPGTVFSEQLHDWPVPRTQRTGNVAANPPLLPGSARPAVVLDSSYPAKNTRIVWDGSTQHIYFPENPPDGARMGVVKASGAAAENAGSLTLDGNGRTIEGTPTIIFAGTPRQWFYRADLADWVPIMIDLTATDSLPFPPEFDDFFITGLTIRLAPSYGKAIQASTTSTNTRVQSAMRIRYFQPTDEGRGGEDLLPAYESYYTRSDFR